MKYTFNLKIVKRYEDNGEFGFNETTEYKNYVSDNKKQLLGELAEIIMKADKCEDDIEYYFKYSLEDNKYNRGYMLASINCLLNDIIDTIIKEVK